MFECFASYKAPVICLVSEETRKSVVAYKWLSFHLEPILPYKSLEFKLACSSLLESRENVLIKPTGKELIIY